MKFSKYTPKKYQSLIADLSCTTTEEEVKILFSKFFDVKINTGDRHDLYTREALFEFKWDKNFEKITERAKILAQALYYIREIKLGTNITSDKTIPPHIVLIDRNEAIIEETITWRRLYDSDSYDWDRSPSAPDPQLVADIARDDAIVMAHIYDLTDSEDFRAFTEKLDNIYTTQLTLDVDNTIDKKLITEDNFESVYLYWKTQIFGERSSKTRFGRLFVADIQGKATLNNESGDLFFNLENGKTELINITPSSYHYFWSLYARVKTISTINGIVAKVDRLSEENLRRREGEFYTPVAFAHLGLQYLADVLGPNWHKEYKIWDMAAGTGNLERHIPAESYHNLYLSTLHTEEVDYLSRIFPGAHTFQYDYLNDDVDLVFADPTQTTLQKETWKLPQALRDDLANHENKWVVLINPPFATSTDHGTTGKNDVSNTKVRKYMSGEDLGNSSQELFCQFLYRIRYEWNEKNLHLGLYSKLKYINSSAYETFREKAFHFDFEKGFMFSSENFIGTKGKFPVGFLIWGISEDYKGESVELNIIESSIQKSGIKTVASTTNEYFLNQWTKRPSNQNIFPAIQNATTIYCGNAKALEKVSENFIGYMWAAGNDFQQQNYTAFFSGPFWNGHGWNMEADNFAQSLVVHTVRRIPKATWINDRDQFLQPSRELSPEFITDCVIWSLFADSNQTSAMQNIAYKGQVYQISNQFFPFLQSEIEGWDCPNPDIFQSLTDRFVARWLRDRVLSSEARAVLDAGRELYRIFYRHWTSLDRYEYKIDTWDVGWYQIRNALKERYGIDEMSVLKEAHRALRAKILPQIYTYGFLPSEMVDEV